MTVLELKAKAFEVRHKMDVCDIEKQKHLEHYNSLVQEIDRMLSATPAPLSVVQGS